MKYELLHADCRDVLANMGDNTVDSIVTDPPYHLTSIVKRFGGANAAPAQFGSDGAFARASRGFMGKEWDGGDIAFDPALWAECLRVLKPGGYLLAFSGTRTYHRMACAIDDAGFEIRDMISWLYGSGFPKSHDISKAIDKAAGAERERGEPRRLPNGREHHFNIGFENGEGYDAAKADRYHTIPATPEAQEWAGWGTALKPACEPICMARKPLIGTVAANVLAHGTGGINIDASRVGTSKNVPSSGAKIQNGAGLKRANPNAVGTGFDPNVGRFPANVAHDGSDEVIGLFPQTTSGGGPAAGTPRSKVNTYGEPTVSLSEPYGLNSGSAARFFYCAKASRRDRNAGLDDPGPQFEHGATLRKIENTETRGNTHPTVKPTDLMRWLVRMVTPPGGLVFDPFTGSGSTGRAAMLEGFRFLGAEMTDEYLPIAHARILDACA